MKIEEVKELAKHLDKLSAELGALILDCKKQGLRVEMSFDHASEFRPVTANLFINAFQLDSDK